jgi:hypothetical protein
MQFDRDLMVPSDAGPPLVAGSSSDVESINLHVVQTVGVILDRKDAVGTINGFRLRVVTARERKTDGAHEYISFAVSGDTGNQNQSESTGGDDTHGEIHLPRAKIISCPPTERQRAWRLPYGATESRYW